VSAPFALFLELHRRHYTSNKLSVHIFAAVCIWLIIAAVLRFLLFLFERLHRRKRADTHRL
jgi:hypothetical protein